MAENVRLVTGCHDCYLRMNNNCYVGAGEVKNAIKNRESHELCPLKQSDITIKLVDK